MATPVTGPNLSWLQAEWSLRLLTESTENFHRVLWNMQIICSVSSKTRCLAPACRMTQDLQSEEQSAAMASSLPPRRIVMMVRKVATTATALTASLHARSKRESSALGEIAAMLALERLNRQLKCAGQNPRASMETVMLRTTVPETRICARMLIKMTGLYATMWEKESALLVGACP